MDVTTTGEYQKNIARFNRNVRDNHDPIRVADSDGDVVVLAADDYENLIESLYILRDYVTVKSIQQTRGSVANGAVPGTEMKDAFNDSVVD